MGNEESLSRFLNQAASHVSHRCPFGVSGEILCIHLPWQRGAQAEAEPTFHSLCPQSGQAVFLSN
jgi:hypothetical protein